MVCVGHGLCCAGPTHGCGLIEWVVDMLTAEMKRIISEHKAGAVATINDDGTPSVSIKATFVIIDDSTIAFGDMRSPGTVCNIQKRSAIEVCFLDVLRRKAVRVAGRAKSIPISKASRELRLAFDADWADYIQSMNGFVEIAVTRADINFSPAYDVGGATEDQLRAIYRARYNSL